MPVQTTYPGVYIEELPSGVRPIIGVATSITAFVGYAPFGPEHTAVRLSSFGDYERRFGGLDAESDMGFAVQQFFRNGGGDALVVRVPNTDAAKAVIRLLDAPSGTFALGLEAASSGSWGNSLAVDVDHADVSDADSYNLTVTDLSTGVSERFADLSVAAGSDRLATVVVNDPDSGSELVRALAGSSGTGRPMAVGTEGGDLGTLTVDATKQYDLQIQPDVPTKDDPSNPGTQIPAIDAITVRVLDKGERLPTSTAGIAAMLTRKINRALADDDAAEGLVVRVVPSSSGDGLRILHDGPAGGDEAPAYTVTSVTAAGDTLDGAAFFELDTGNAGVTENVGRYEPGGTTRLGLGVVAEGKDGTQLPGTNQLIGNEGQFTGMYALLKTDLFNLLCIPDATRAKKGEPTEIDSSVDPDAIWSAGYDLCVKRRAMLMIDPDPSVDDADNALDWITDLGTKGANAVAHFPRLRIPDATNDFQPRTVAPSGTMAGLYARTDGERGVWKAPAGIEARLRGLSGVVYHLTDAENGRLNPLGLNCARTFPAIGTVNWGGRTTDGADILASQWKYTPVRRLALYIEESVFRGTKWAVFEPNDEPLWTQLRLNLTSFMQDLFRKGAFAGATPREAYLVKCDHETTTRDDVDRGVVNVLVGFAPLKPAEFVVIRIQQLAGESTS